MSSNRVAIANSPDKVRHKQVARIVADRLNPYTGEEQYLVKWKSTNKHFPPLSWHTVPELQPVLDKVQQFLERQPPPSLSSAEINPRKRKSPSGEDNENVTSFNGRIKSEYGFIVCEESSDPDVSKLQLADIPKPRTNFPGQRRTAVGAIRDDFLRSLRGVTGPRIKIVNDVDESTPSLRFRFTTNNLLRNGVIQADPATMMGCESCSPRMGRNIGCEYTKKCECLEYALVHVERLTEKQRELYEYIQATGDGSTFGLPKKFPYYSTENEKNGCLVSFYLESRHPIYECNSNCKCGPQCKTRVVQHGRKVELQIFKTQGRGWGLRCTTPLLRGQFIDTYRGEIITDAEASAREEKGGKYKSSYLYSLDKFAQSQQLKQEDVYVIDGEFFGGPTRFINHSCEPNCRQYVVCYNKHDYRVYDIAFFAYRDIPAYEELTFDYLDKDEEEDDEDETERKESPKPNEDAIPCACGSRKCRKWLWT